MSVFNLFLQMNHLNKCHVREKNIINLTIFKTLKGIIYIISLKMGDIDT